MKRLNQPLKRVMLCVLALMLVSISVLNAQAKYKKPVTVPLRFDYYYTYDMVNDALHKLHKAYPHLTKLDLVGKSEEGRSIYCMTVTNPKKGKELEKPGIWVDGNIHGNEIQAGEVCLYLLDYLLQNYGKNKEITKLVDTKVFYVVPSVNPDGRYHFFADGNHDSSNRTIRRPHDDDRDGLLDEDPPDDLDGDGNICVMRIKDPHGRFKTDPEDSRLMVRVKPGEKGEWRILGDEGIDNDEDGRVNEDSPGYVDPNRNWGYDWMPPYVQAGAGWYPFSGVGLKALSQYIVKRPNICIGWSFHNFGGMFLRGPSTKAQGEYHPRDVAVYDYLGKQAERITPGYHYLISWKDLYSTYGDSVEWLVNLHGCYGFVGELSPTSSYNFRSVEENKKAAAAKRDEYEDDEGPNLFERDPDKERQILKFSDHLVQGQLYKDWKKFKHPVYGNIEIGGWIKFSKRIPPPFMIKDMVHRNASSILFSAKHTPDVKMKILGKKKIGDNVYRIRVRLINKGAMPTMTYQAQNKNLYPKDLLKASGKGVKIVAGGKINNLFTDNVSYKEHRPDVQFFAIPGFGKVEYQFLVSGTGSVTIKYMSRHAGKIVKTVQLN